MFWVKSTAMITPVLIVQGTNYFETRLLVSGTVLLLLKCLASHTLDNAYVRNLTNRGGMAA